MMSSHLTICFEYDGRIVTGRTQKDAGLGSGMRILYLAPDVLRVRNTHAGHGVE